MLLLQSIISETQNIKKKKNDFIDDSDYCLGSLFKERVCKKSKLNNEKKNYDINLYENQSQVNN